jgi:hypothetical protein
MKRLHCENPNNPNCIAAGISGGVCVNHLWPVVAGGGGMTKDEALDLALAYIQEVDYGPYDSKPVITAIKQALAAPVQEPVVMPENWFAGMPEEYRKEAWRVATPPAAQPAPVQEPVEFFDWYDNAHWGNEDFKEGCHRSWNAAIKYTTPPAEPVQPVACECNQGQVCHVCDPITPSKQSAQQEPSFWYYTLVVEGQVVGENFTTVNWDTRVEPFGRYDIDHGGKVTKQPLYTTPPAAQRQWVGLTDDEWDKLADKYSMIIFGGLKQEIEDKLKEKNSLPTG